MGTKIRIGLLLAASLSVGVLVATGVMVEAVGALSVASVAGLLSLRRPKHIQTSVRQTQSDGHPVAMPARLRAA